uniref:Uncharacterized protein n=1 Tax=Rhizophora mucronata TaxID=61149 RepID=A0A2P2NPX1_RHIMU
MFFCFLLGYGYVFGYQSMNNYSSHSILVVEGRILFYLFS